MTTSLPSRPSRETQLRFDEIERQLPSGRPLAPLKAVMFLLDRSEDGVKYLYESGALEYAFDLSSGGAARAEVRIYRESVVNYMRKSRLLANGHHPTEQEVVAACLPSGRAAVQLSDLTRLWTVSSTHLHDLCKAGELTALPGQKLGPKQTPLLARASVAEFLKRRRIV